MDLNLYSIIENNLEFKNKNFLTKVKYFFSKSFPISFHESLSTIILYISLRERFVCI